MTTCKASFFAGPEDTAAFRKCKAQGHTDQHCFALGDNGIGAWGHDTTRTDLPMCALPREIWTRAGKKGGDLVDVTYKGKTVRGILGDTMPSTANIKNGCGIDLNPGFALEFGIPLERMNSFTLDPVTWQWV